MGRKIKAQQKRDIIGALTKQATLDAIAKNTDYPYIHSNVEMFRLGYTTIASTLNSNLHAAFDPYRQQFSKLYPRLRAREQQIYQALGVANAKELNQIYQYFSTTKFAQTSNVVDALLALRTFKTSAMDARALDDESKKAKYTEIIADLNAELAKFKNSNTNGSTLQQTQKFITALSGNQYVQFDKFVGNTFEEVFTVWLQKIYAFLHTAEGQKTLDKMGITMAQSAVVSSIEQVMNPDQRTKTTDVMMTLANGVNIGFTLKTGRDYGKDSQYIDAFTGVKGYSIKNKSKEKYKPGETQLTTAYQITELKDIIGADTYNYLMYVLVNYKTLNKTKDMVHDTLQYLSYGLAWYHLMVEIFGSSFAQGLLTNQLDQFPAFLVTLYGIYPLSDLCQYIGTLTFEDIGLLITKPFNNTNNRYLIQTTKAKSQHEQLYKKKRDLIKKTKPRVTYTDLHSLLLNDSILASMVESVKLDTSYMVKYRIKLDNIEQFVQGV